MKKYLVLFVLILAGLNSFSQTCDSLLVGYWSFNGSSDDSSKNLKVTHAYGAKLAPDRFDNASCAYSFDGIDDFIEIRDFGTVIPKKVVSICMWTKSLGSRTQNQFMFEANGTRCAISIDNYREGKNDVTWEFGSKGEAGYAPGKAYCRPIPYDDKWHHYVFISNAETNQMKIYRDNELITLKSDAVAIVTDQVKSLKIGSGYNNNYYYGLIDDIRIYACELTPEEINIIYSKKY